MLAAAVCPHPPLLVPDVAPGTDAELAELREACADAVRAAIATRPGRVVVIGTGDLAHERDESAGGTLAPYGVDVRAGGDELCLPLSLTIGAWLLDEAGWSGPRTYSTGRPTTDDDVALLVMADGTNGRSEKAPGFLDERAEPFDAAIAKALGSGDVDALAGLDPALGAELGSSGVPALLMLADAASRETAKGATVAARLHYDGAPLGVGYLVADWVLDA